MRRLSFSPSARSRLLASVGVLTIAGFALDRAIIGEALVDRANAGEAARASASSSAGCELVDPWTEQEDGLRERLLSIAGEYLRYGRVDDEARWAPELCREPRPAMARFSAADDRQGHGQKLYFLFARDRAAYVGLGAKGTVAPRFQLGKKGEPQVIVKESWVPEAYDGTKPPDTRQGRFHDAPRNDAISFGGSYYPFAQKDGKTYQAANKAGLFIMLQAQGKLAGAAPTDTDDGWLYGTVSADGKTVTAAGKIASCMGCHQQATHGRLFGPLGKAQEQRSPTR